MPFSHGRTQRAIPGWFIFLLFFAWSIHSFAQQSASELPKGVKIKAASEADNALAKSSLEKALAGEAIPKDLLSGTFTCGPTLWASLKKSADEKLLHSKVVTMMMSDPEPFQTVARGLITQEQREALWTLLRSKYPALKGAKVRKANADELRYYWATIPFDSIEEPFFAIEAGQQKFIVNLKIEKNTPRLVWIDTVGDLGDLHKQVLTPDEVKEFEAVAQLGLPLAMYEVGMVYISGRGVPVDVEKGRTWLERAAEKDSLAAQMALGSMYLSGINLPKDHTMAAKYIVRAANQQNVDHSLKSVQALAQYWIALMYKDGSAIEKSEAKWLQYLQLAAENGNYPAQYDLGSLYESGAGGLAMDKPKACGLFVKAAEQGHPKALHNAGYCYHSGTGVNQDARMAIVYYTKATEQGDVRSAYNMGVLYGQMGQAEGSYFWLRVAELSGIEQAKPLAEEAKASLTATQIAAEDNKITIWLDTHKAQKH